MDDDNGYFNSVRDIDFTAQIKIKMSGCAIFSLPGSGLRLRKYRNSQQCVLFFMYFVTIMLDLASAEKRTIVELRKLEKTPLHKLTVGAHSSGTDLTARLIGKLTGLGRENEAIGRVHMLPGNCEDDVKGFARLPSDWVAVIHYTDRVIGSTDNGTSQACPSVIDRMRKAFMFGASAIIILTMNPNIIKELDVGQLFSKPVVLVDIAENVTNMLQIFASKLKIKAKFVYNVTVDIVQSHNLFTTVTLWGKCGRYGGKSYHDWDGVVCLGYPDAKNDAKVDPENFWNYFYMGILLLMMMHYLRKRRAEDWEDPDYFEGHIRELAYQALSVMKIKRYSHDSGLDTCAICLEKFFHKQKLRVLPCGHHFHTKCVDPWLVRNHTCPLCKLNIIEKFDL